VLIIVNYLNNDDSGSNPLIDMNSITLVNDFIQSLNDQYVKQIMDLKQVVNNQSVIIDTIVNRLNLMLSMFNIDEVAVPPLSMDPYNSDVLNLLSIPSSKNSSIHPSSGDLTHSSVAQSYSSVASRNSQTNHSKEQLFKFRQSMVAAAYVDQNDKDRRSTRFIVSGLPTSSVCSDQKIVADLCLNEFNTQVDIASTKRLGNSSTSSSTSAKIQRLLVSVKNLERQ
jgi:hypothetical protein